MPSTPLLDNSVPGYAVHAHPTDPTGLLVATDAPQDWVSREYADAHDVPGGRITHPTAIVWQGNSYRVESASRVGTGCVFVLLPWPDNDRRVRIVHLEAGWIAAEQQGRRDFQREMLLGRLSTWYSWVAGFAPARVQRALEDRWNMDASEATARSGMIEFAIGGIICALGPALMILAMYSGSSVGHAISVLGLLMVFEGVARFMSGRNDGVAGPLVVELADRLWLLAARRPRID